MFYQVLMFLLEVAVTLLGGACLLRAYMRWRAMPMVNPVGRFVQALTDWMALPLQRILPPTNRIDAASLLAAWLLKLLHFAAVMALLDMARWVLLPVLALLGVVKLAVSVATAVIIVAALMSWTGARSEVAYVLDRLSAPWLAPLRRIVPLVGGVDLSPLLAIVALQVLSMVLGGLQAQLLGAQMFSSVG